MPPHSFLPPQVSRGLVYSLTHSRLLPEATTVYRAAVRWGTYSRQTTTSRPLKLLLTSSLTTEEMCVIILAFLARLKASTGGNLTIFVHMHEETSGSGTRAAGGVRPLACVPTRKEEGLARLQRVVEELEPSLGLTSRGQALPCVQDRLVRRFLASRLNTVQSSGT